LCDPDLRPLLFDGPHWRLVLNYNQDLLAKCFLALRRHEESVLELTAAEWIDLQHELDRATRMVATTFRPDHFNYAFLQNQDRHVHLHIIPRYATPRSFGERVFEDTEYPGHYAVGAPAVHLRTQELSVLAAALRDGLTHR